MRKWLLFLSCFMIPMAHSLFAQDDSSFFKNIIIKINPTLVSTGILGDGEYGGIIQFPLIRHSGKNINTYWQDEDGYFHKEKNIDSISHGNVDAYIGAGYNTDNNLTIYGATGYTFRGGFYFYQRKHYFSIQFFYRRWNINGIYGVGDYFANTWESDIINPTTAIFDYTGDLNYYEIDNAVVNVYAADVLYGFQFPRHRRPGKLFFELFVGAGLRFKNIELEEIEATDPNSIPSRGTPGTFYTLSTPVYSNEGTINPDIKLGFMVGIVL